MTKFEYDPNEWENLEVVEIPNPVKEGSGIQVRAYKKNTDTAPRIAINEYYLDRDENKRHGKSVRIHPNQIEAFIAGLGSIHDTVRMLDNENV